MYSPKINEDLIPYIYKISKKWEMPMTMVVDQLLRELVLEIYEELENIEDYERLYDSQHRKE